MVRLTGSSGRDAETACAPVNRDAGGSDEGSASVRRQPKKQTSAGHVFLLCSHIHYTSEGRCAEEEESGTMGRNRHGDAFVVTGIEGPPAEPEGRDPSACIAADKNCRQRLKKY